MNINTFILGYAYKQKQYKFEDLINPSISHPKSNTSGFSTWSLLENNNYVNKAITLELATVGVEDYQINEDQLREQAILRAASVLQLRKNEDGTVEVDPSTSDPAAARAKYRETGGQKQISWQWVDTNLSWHSMPGSDMLDTVALNIDYYASEYAQYKNRIEQQFTGEERTAELARLEALFNSHVEEAATNFAQTVGGFLETNGVIGEQEAIHNSFWDIYEQRKTTYLDFIDENPDYAHIKGTADEWLLTAGSFMGEQLRYAFISQQPDMNLTSKYGYSIDDLTASGTLVKEMAGVQNRSQSLDRSEEELGVQLGMAAMKYELLSGHFNISSSVKKKLDQSFNNFISNEIDRISAHIEQQRRDPFVRNKEAYLLDYDKLHVLRIINSMVENLKSSDDINTAFKSDMDTFISLYKNKAQNIQHGSLSRYNVLYSSWVNKNYVSDWNRFVLQLSAFNNEEISQYLFNDNIKLVEITV